MSTPRRIHEEASRWAQGHSISGQVPIADLVLRSHGYEFPPIALFELPAEELALLLAFDHTARTGASFDGVDAGASLCIAALRLRLIASRWSSVDDDSLEPRSLIRAVATLRRMLGEARAFFADFCQVAKQGDVSGPRTVVEESLAGVDIELRDLEFQMVAKLGKPKIPASRNAHTLADEFIFIEKLVSYPDAFHVRVFRTADRQVVVLGDIHDNSVRSILDVPGKLITALRHAVPELNTENTTWAHYRPAEFGAYCLSARLGTLFPEDALPERDSVRIIVPSNSNDVEIVELTFEELQQLIRGPMRRWHAADYTIPRLVAEGVRVLDGTRRQTPGDMLLVRCGRLLCQAGYFAPLRELVDTQCPACRSRTFQPIRII